VSPPLLLPGTRLGRYEIGARLGTGGQGVVYEATLLGPGGLRKAVALKVSPGADAGLSREARLGGLLRHRHLVDVYEQGFADGLSFTALELCPDGTVADLPLPLSERAVREVGLAVSDALRYAHEELGLVHRDLKPQNLLLKGAVVKVGDLGIAQATEFPADPRRISGTRGYMPREQRLGHDVDATADIYALGVVLHVLSTGILPRSDDTFALDDDTTLEPGGEVHRPLAPIVDRCLRPEPAERYRSMAELHAALLAVSPRGEGLAALIPGVVEAPDDVGAPAPLVGRAREVAEVLAALSGLVTLRGPPGVGKTRLAHAVADAAGVGTTRVAVAAVPDGEGLVSALADALEAPLGRGAPEARAAQLGRALARRGRHLLVVDNVEQIAEAGAVLAALRDAAPEAVLLVTSRAPTGAPGERVVDVSPLPDDDAVALLRARALARGVPGDALAEATLRAIAARLDGLPLALELAAGRIGVLAPEEVLERLSLDVLRSGDEGRHATLRATLAWSVDLLRDDARSTLAQLSVFPASFTLEAVEAVVRSPSPRWSLDVLQELIDHSLVRVVAPGRCELLVAVRAFAAERLDALGGGDRVRARHVAHARARWTRPELEALAREAPHSLQLDAPDAWAAGTYALELGDAEAALVTAEHTWLAVRRRGPFPPLLARLRAVEDRSDALAPASRARARSLVGQLLRMTGELAAAEQAATEALALATAAHDAELRARCLLNVGMVRVDRAADAVPTLREALAAYRALGDTTGEILVQVNLGNAVRRADPAAARTAYETARDLAREVGDRYHAVLATGSLGIVAAEAGDVPAARAAFEETLSHYRRAGDRLNEANQLGNLGTLLWRTEPDTAERAFREALAIHREAGNVRGQGLVVGQLAQLLATRPGGRDEARALHREGIALATKLGDAEELAFNQRQLAALDADPSPGR
jgi:predicted ATPase